MLYSVNTKCESEADEIAMISDDVRFRYECNRNAFRRCVPVKVECKWNAIGTRMEREWNANGTHLGTRSGRVFC